MSEKKEDKPKEVKVKKQAVVVKPKYVRKNYTLEQDLEVSTKDGLKTLKKGTKISLTEIGAKHYKSKKYIK